MSISDLFIRRPVATTLVMGGILVFGILGYKQLPVSDLPTVDFPTINVSASLPGASPETMASAVATPLEKQFSTIAGLDSMTSSSAQGSTSIVLQFALDRNIDAAAQDVQASIAKTMNQLPQNILPPSYQKVNPADSPILFFALMSPSLPLSTLDEYGQTLMAQRISMVSGVAQVQVYGSQKYAVRMLLDPNALASRGIGIDEVANAISNGNVNLPTGILWGTNKAFTVQASGQLQNASAFRPLIVTYRNGSPVRLGDLGDVLDSVQNDKVAAWYNDSRTIMLAIQRQPGTNTVAVATAVKSLMEKLKLQLPASVDVQILYDRSVSIRQSINDVRFTLLLTLFLVILVIFLFLRNLSATIIPSLALPLSVVGTFGIMYLLGYSLDNLSLMALTLSVGFVVDDAIVMLENIVRHMEMGKAAPVAAVDGAREVGFTIISMTLSLAAVFIPLLFMGGIIGRLFHEFAVTISSAILVSGFVSLTLTPMMCSRFLTPSREAHHGRFYAVTENWYEKTRTFYEDTLAWVMRHRVSSLVFSALILVGTIYLFGKAHTGFLPSEDIGLVRGSTEGAEGISFDSMKTHQQVIANIIRKDPNVDALLSSVGAGGPNATNNQGRFFIRLKPRAQRELSAQEFVEDVRSKLAQVPGIKVYLQVPPPISIGGQSTKSLYQFTLQTSDIRMLYSVVPALETKIRDLPGLTDVASDLLIKNPQVNVEIDRDKASLMGVSAQDIESALYNAYGSRQVSTIYTATNQYWVIMQLQPQYQNNPSALNLLYVRSDTGKLVPLSTVARLSTGVGPLLINHSGQTPSVTMSFNLKPGYSIGEAITQVQKVARQVLPSTITSNFAGTAQAFQSSQAGLGVLLILAIMVIYMVLGILYESFVHPITILTGLPFAGFGALLTLMIFRSELNVYSFVGLVMLIGVVKKNAIMMIDFAIEAQRSEGLTPADAIQKAASIRFRPIMMTTMAAFMGTLPIALGLGSGSESRRPLGLAVVGGLAFSQVVTLYVTPVFYTYLDALQTRFSRAFRRKAAAPYVPDSLE